MIQIAQSMDNCCADMIVQTETPSWCMTSHVNQLRLESLCCGGTFSLATTVLSIVQ